MSKVKEGLIFLGVVLVLVGAFFSIMRLTSSKAHQEVSPTVSKKQDRVKAKKVPSISLYALGDSLTHGVGDTSNRGGYVYLVKQKLEHQNQVKVTSHNYGKTGDRSDQIQARLEKSKQMQAELKQADVITLTVGGNDMMKVLQDNFLLLANNKLAGAMPKAKEDYRLKLTSLFKTIRHYNEDAPIFLISIYNPFYVYFPTLTDLQKYTNQWNVLAKQVANRDGNTYFVDVNRQLSEGQYLGQDKKQLIKESKLNLSSVSSTKLEDILSDQKEKNNYLSDADHFHPNDKGYRYMTKELYQVMMAHKDKWLKEDK